MAWWKRASPQTSQRYAQVPAAVREALSSPAQRVWQEAYTAGCARYPEPEAVAFAWAAVARAAAGPEVDAAAVPNEVRGLAEASVYADYLPALDDGRPSYETILAGLKRALRELHDREHSYEGRQAMAAETGGAVPEHPPGCAMIPVATFPDYCVYEMDGALYRAGYAAVGTAVELDPMEDHAEVAAGFEEVDEDELEEWFDAQGDAGDGDLPEAEAARYAAVAARAGVLAEAAPPGWEATVKRLKRAKGVDNPYALAWYMHGQGFTPGAGKRKKTAHA